VILTYVCIKENQLFHDLPFTGQDYFNLNSKTYDAYDKDIAVVEVFFRKSTVIQMGSQPMY